MAVASGQLLGHGRFEVLARLGEGGGGVVFEVRDRQSDARLALKTVRIAEPDALVCLKREFRAVQDVAHPNLMRLDELFEEDGAWFFTMELVDGTDWLAYVGQGDTRGHGFDERRLRATLVQIVEALAALHATGVVHRDVKPTNVLVSSAGHVKLLDFGIATRARGSLDAQREGIVGTVAYMAPEQLLSEEPTPAGDFYAVGVMLHQALTGKVPFEGSASDVMHAKLATAPAPVRQRAPHAPADLAALCDALLRSDPRERPSAASILRVLGASDLASSGENVASPEEFVGRRKELRALSEAFAAVQRGATVSMIVLGPSGFGKSALVRHFLRDLDDSALVLAGRCHEREYVPFNGVDAVVDALARHLGEEPDEALAALDASAMRLLPRLFPVLLSVPFFAPRADGSPSIAEGEPHELRARIFGAFRELLAQTAKRTTLVLAIDDLQWADGDTLALLGDVLALPSPPPLLLLCTQRLAHDDAVPLQDDAQAPAGETAAPPLSFPGDVRRIRLGPLGDDEVAELATQLSRTTQLGAAELTAIAAESGGHPLFLQELLRRRAEGATSLRTVRLDDALWNRVTRLTEEERRIVELVAVAGVPTALDLIVSAAAIPRGEIPQHMAMLRNANLVKISGPSSTRSIEPYHDRVREAVILHLDAGTRRTWHERLARTLEASPELDVERLAVHWEAAGDTGRAARLFREAAERASAALAFDRAVEFYRRALALFGAESPEKPGIERALAQALFNAGRGGEAGHAFLALAGGGMDRASVELRNRGARAFLGSGHFAEGVVALRSVVVAVGIAFPDSRLAVIFRIIWHRLLLRIFGLHLVRRDPSTVSPAEVLKVDVCWSAAHGFGMTDSVTAQVFHALGVRLALRIGDPSRFARALCGQIVALSVGGRKARRQTAEALHVARELAAELRDPYIDAYVDICEGFAAYMLDNWQTAKTHFSRAEVRFRDFSAGASYEIGSARGMLGRTLAQLGSLRELEPFMGPPLRDAVRRRDLFNVVSLRATVGTLLALAHDDVPRAAQEVAETEKALASQGFQLQHAYWLVAGGILDIYRGAPEQALARLDAHRGALRRSLLETVQSIRVMLMFVRVRAHLALAMKDAAHHMPIAARCIEQLRREGLPAAGALARLTGAALRAQAGDRAGATALLREAIAGFDAIEMKLHAAAARHVLGGLLGGAEGADLVRRALACLDEEGVVAPQRFVHLYATGFPAP